MKVYGNIEALKSSIKKKYSAQIRAIEKDIEKKIKELKKETERKIALIKSRTKTLADLEAKKLYAMLMNEAILKAKRDFEKKREELINKVFDEAYKKAKKIAHTHEYIEYVKRKIPKEELEVIGDSPYYEKFFPNLKIDKNVIGLKFKSTNVVYDFSLDSGLKSQKEKLRHIINKILFEG